MKLVASIITAVIFCASCSKKDSAVVYDIKNITGHYSGQALTWEKSTDGNKTSGSDAAASFDLVYVDADKVTVKVNTSADLLQKNYEMKLIGKSENPGSGAGYVFQLLETSGDIQINTLLKITNTNTMSATLEYTRYSTGETNSEKYKVTGLPSNN